MQSPPFGQSSSSMHGSQLLPVPLQLPKRCAQVAIPSSLSHTSHTAANPHGQELIAGSHCTVQILLPLRSRAQIWLGLLAQSALVSHELQKSRSKHILRISESGPQKNSLPSPIWSAWTQRALSGAPRKPQAS